MREQLIECVPNFSEGRDPEIIKFCSINRFMLSPQRDYITKT